MPTGQGSVQFNARKLPSGAPFPAGSARNGLSVDGAGFIVLGQDLGDPLNPALLLNAREIPLNGQFIGFEGISIGLEIDDGSQIIQLFDLASTALIQLNASNNTVILQSGNNTGFLLDGTNRTITGKPGNDPMLFLDDLNAVAQIGRLNAGNFEQLIIDDTNQLIQVLDSTNPYLSLDVLNGVFTLGDLNGATGNNLLYLDLTQFTVQLGTPLSTVINAGGLAGRYTFGATNFGNNTRIEIDDRNANKSFNIFATNGVQINATPGFTGVVTPVTTITVIGGIVTNVA